MLAGIARVVVGLIGTIALLGAWMLFFIGLMGICLYVMRLFPLTGQWRKRLRERRRAN
jgi:hypothetical protein